MVNSSKRVIESLLLYRRRSLPLRFPSRSGGNIFSSPLTQAAAAYSSSSIPPQNPTTAAGFSNLRGSSDIKPRLLLPSNYRGFAHNPYYVIGINNNRSNHHLPLLLHQERIINNRGGLGGWCSSTTSSRCLFSKASSSDAKLKKIVVDKPLSVIRSAFVRYRGAVCLQIEAFWKRNYMVLLGAGAFGLCLLLWRIMFGIADTFIGFSEGMAKYGFLALSSAIVAFLGLYVRSRFTINPDKVYRIAMRKLNTSAGILEVMGAPLSGTDLRAYIMSSGGLRLKNFKPMLGGKRCFLIFPIQGSERKGLVSVEVKKKKGQYDMKLLAVDVPMTTGPDQRFFLIGDEEEYKVGGGLISELRDPIVKAMAAAKEFEALDQKEEEEDEEREQKEAERKNREEIEKLEKRN